MGYILNTLQKLAHFGTLTVNFFPGTGTNPNRSRVAASLRSSARC